MDYLILPGLLTALTFAFLYYVGSHKEEANDLQRGITVALTATTVFAWVSVAVIWAWNLAMSAAS